MNHWHGDFPKYFPRSNRSDSIQVAGPWDFIRRFMDSFGGSTSECGHGLLQKMFCVASSFGRWGYYVCFLFSEDVYHTAHIFHALG